MSGFLVEYLDVEKLALLLERSEAGAPRPLLNMAARVLRSQNIRLLRQGELIESQRIEFEEAKADLEGALIRASSGDPDAWREMSS